MKILKKLAVISLVIALITLVTKVIKEKVNKILTEDKLYKEFYDINNFEMED